MAEAIDDTIPCERCNTQVTLQDWPRHLRKCVDSRTKSAERKRRDTSDNESDNEQIPCEFCNTLISKDDWKSHSKTCADVYRQRIENLRNGMDNEPIDASIPCEYCDTQVSVHDLEWHTRQCANNHRRGSKNEEKDESALIPCEYCDTSVNVHELEWHTRQCANGQRSGSKKSKNSSDEPALIPCEYCNAPVSAHEWELHTNKCAQAERKRIADLAKRIETEVSDELIPCESCNKSVSMRKFDAHQKRCGRKKTAAAFRPDTPQDQVSENNTTFPEHWDDLATKNLTRYILTPGTDEYQFVADKFHETLRTNQIAQIERIQNRRWYRQYDAHKDDFIERYGNSTEQWLFHGCRRSESAEAIILDCFNRSHAVNCAVGQGIYFAAQAAISHGYTHPDAQRLRHMFMARVLIGRTTRGNASTRVCPPGFDTTGGGNVFVTYHDAQAYGQYLIAYR